METRTFAADPAEAAKVRSFLANATRLDSMRAAEVALLATELIANAVRHGNADQVEVAVEPRELMIRIAVSHEADAPLGEVTPGFGFTLVDRLSRDWGHSNHDGRLTVWFEARAPGALSMSPVDMEESELIGMAEQDPVYAEELVGRYQALAFAIARRYQGKGIADEDLEQVALIALLKAIHRYKPERGPLKSYAAVTVAGELKRQVRDRGWSIHVPRGLQERSLEVARAAQELAQTTGKMPTPEEIAEKVGDVTAPEVAEAMSAAQSYRAASLDEPDQETGQALLDMLGDVDQAIGDTAERTVIEEALQKLKERERLIVYLRFYEDMTQSQIADVIGVSQMQISRLLAKSLEEMSKTLDLDV